MQEKGKILKSVEDPYMRARGAGHGWAGLPGQGD